MANNWTTKIPYSIKRASAIIISAVALLTAIFFVDDRYVKCTPHTALHAAEAKQLDTSLSAIGQKTIDMMENFEQRQDAKLNLFIQEQQTSNSLNRYNAVITQLLTIENLLSQEKLKDNKTLLSLRDTLTRQKVYLENKLGINGGTP